MFKKIITKFFLLVLSKKMIKNLIRFFNKLLNKKENKGNENPFDKIDVKPPYKLNVGCGSNLKDGWINIDLSPHADICADVTKGIPLPDNSSEIIYSEHFLEHLKYPNESMPFLAESYRLLKEKGVMHLGVPDSRYVVESCITEPIKQEFLDKCKKNNWGYPSFCTTGFEYINYHFRLDEQHKFAFDFSTLKSQLERIGFKNIKKRDFIPSLDTKARFEGSIYVVCEK